MKASFIICLLCWISLSACGVSESVPSGKTAAEILGNPDYPAIAYGGFRDITRDSVPSVEQIKEDLKILHALGFRLLRTYNTTHYPHTGRLLEAIRGLKAENRDFEMYLMMGAWISCKDAWTAKPDHSAEDIANSTAEIEGAVALANAYPDSVKIIAVGNEAMVHWAASYFVVPEIILKWVNHLQEMKRAGTLPADIWITSSDNFASWGGGDTSYHTEGLTRLISAVDYVSLHTYPFHDTHYNSEFWEVPEAEADLPDRQKIAAAMQRAGQYAKDQYGSVVAYLQKLGIEKPVHIGETGWSSVSGSLYGPDGSHAADEYKMKLYYDYIKDWTSKSGITCVYFSAFDEKWKDAAHPSGSENHFGLINLQGEVKYVFWETLDNGGILQGLSRDGKVLDKTFGGDEAAMLSTVLPPVSHP